ncbi:MAG: dihydroorotate dehydrogenase electron transfer subunit [Bacillota bacterium]
MQVKNNIQVGPDIYKMILKFDKNIKVKAGQFIHMKVSKSGYDPLLRRPFSIYDFNEKENTIAIVYKVCGKGTKLMRDFKKNDEIDVLATLGNGFDLNIKNKNIFLIGGGMGIAPLYYLAKFLKKNNNLKIILGAKSKYELSYFNTSFSKLGIDIHCSTMDGSLGFKGTAVELWTNLMKKNNFHKNIDYIYTCGPTPMLKEVQQLIKNNNIEGEASLEERMGCGVGVCLSCTVKTVNGNKRACKEGPVFKLKDVIFDE